MGDKAELGMAPAKPKACQCAENTGKLGDSLGPCHPTIDVTFE